MLYVLYGLPGCVLCMCCDVVDLWCICELCVVLVCHVARLQVLPSWWCVNCAMWLCCVGILPHVVFVGLPCGPAARVP